LFAEKKRLSYLPHNELFLVLRGSTPPKNRALKALFELRHSLFWERVGVRGLQNQMRKPTGFPISEAYWVSFLNLTCATDNEKFILDNPDKQEY
jgi:hypothetical protein